MASDPPPPPPGGGGVCRYEYFIYYPGHSSFEIAVKCYTIEIETSEYMSTRRHDLPWSCGGSCGCACRGSCDAWLGASSNARRPLSRGTRSTVPGSGTYVVKHTKPSPHRSTCMYHIKLLPEKNIVKSENSGIHVLPFTLPKGEKAPVRITGVLCNKDQRYDVPIMGRGANNGKFDKWTVKPLACRMSTPTPKGQGSLFLFSIAWKVKQKLKDPLLGNYLFYNKHALVRAFSGISFHQDKHSEITQFPPPPPRGGGGTLTRMRPLLHSSGCVCGGGGGGWGRGGT